MSNLTYSEENMQYAKNALKSVDFNMIFPADDPFAGQVRIWAGDENTYQDKLLAWIDSVPDLGGRTKLRDALADVFTSVKKMKMAANGQTEDADPNELWSDGITEFNRNCNKLREALNEFNDSTDYNYSADPQMQALQYVTRGFSRLQNTLAFKAAEPIIDSVSDQCDNITRRSVKFESLLKTIRNNTKISTYGHGTVTLDQGKLNETLDKITKKRKQLQNDIKKYRQLQIPDGNNTLSKEADNAVSDYVSKLDEEEGFLEDVEKPLKGAIEAQNELMKTFGSEKELQETQREKNYFDSFRDSCGPARVNDTINRLILLNNRVDRKTESRHRNSTEFKNMKDSLQKAINIWNTVRTGGFDRDKFIDSLTEAARNADIYLNEKNKGLFHSKDNIMRNYRIAFAKDLRELAGTLTQKMPGDPVSLLERAARENAHVRHRLIHGKTSDNKDNYVCRNLFRAGQNMQSLKAVVKEQCGHTDNLDRKIADLENECSSRKAAMENILNAGKKQEEKKEGGPIL